jgi:hypothetical protein
LLLAGNSTVNATDQGGTGDSADATPLPANGGMGSACDGRMGIAAEVFYRDLCEKRIELAKSVYWHYGMGHGFHRVGRKLF